MLLNACLQLHSTSFDMSCVHIMSNIDFNKSMIHIFISRTSILFFKWIPFKFPSWNQYLKNKMLFQSLCLITIVYNSPLRLFLISVFTPSWDSSHLILSSVMSNNFWLNVRYKISIVEIILYSRWYYLPSEIVSFAFGWHLG